MGSSCTRLEAHVDDRGVGPSKKRGVAGGIRAATVHMGARGPFVGGTPHPTAAKRRQSLQQQQQVLANPHALLAKQSSDVVKPSSASPRPAPLRRANSTSTLYVSSTIDKPDDNTTIDAVALVIHDLLKVHNDEEKVSVSCFEPTIEQLILGRIHAYIDIPPVSEVSEFILAIFEQGQLSSECSIIALVYIKRLLRATQMTLSYSNWRNVVFGALMLASKVWDDLSMINIDFTVVCPIFTIQQANMLEVQYLQYLDYSVAVTGQEYAQEYFCLCDVLEKHRERRLPVRPLDKDGARRLEIRSANVEDVVRPTQQLALKRSTTLHDSGQDQNKRSSVIIS